MSSSTELQFPSISNVISGKTGIAVQTIDLWIETVYVIAKVIYITIVACIKSIIPAGVLPRKNVRGEVVLITGAGSGIGRLMALEFAKLGARIVVWDINEKGNEETKKLVENSGAECHAYTVDISKNTNIYEAADRVKAEVGRVDILINNAGIVTGKKLFDCPDELMEKTMAVNTNAMFYTGKSFIPAMMERNHGHVVTIASIAGHVGVTGLVDYCASKHGAVGFHKSITAELAMQNKNGVKTTVVCPVYISTGMFDGVIVRFPLLFPILTPEYVVDCIMESVLTDRVVLAIPKIGYLAMLAVDLLPSEAWTLIQRFTGVDDSMTTFHGRSKA